MIRTKPVARYRMQLVREFSFYDLLLVIPCLDRIGISTVYAVPIFQAVSGSCHRYGATEPHRLNPEIRAWENWSKIRQDMNQRNMTWLLDIVPNPMAYYTTNKWLQDIFQWGRDFEVKGYGYRKNPLLQLLSKASDVFTGVSYSGENKLNVRNLLPHLPAMILTNMNYEDGKK